jgi:regulator of RNase E activity RraA
MTPPSDIVLNKLAEFDTPTICNIIELFDVRPRDAGYMDGRIKACFPEMPPVVGFAATATFRSAVAPGRGGTYSSLADHIAQFAQLGNPAIVVFQDLDDPPAAATFGEIMCTAYKAFGAVGLITSGAGRDLDQVRALSFPVFTNGTICAHGYCQVLQVGTPVHVGGVPIYPNDLLHGDCNGVTTVPHEIAAEVADVGNQFLAAEAVVLDVLRSGSPSLQELREATDEKNRLVAKLRAELSRFRMTERTEPSGSLRNPNR